MNEAVNRQSGGSSGRIHMNICTVGPLVHVDQNWLSPGSKTKGLFSRDGTEISRP